MVNQYIRVLTSKDGEMNVYPPTNSVIISDYGTNVERVMKILTQLDVQGFEDQLEVIPVRYAKAKDIADLIDKIVNKGDKTATANRPNGGFTSGVPRFGTTSGTQGAKGGAYFMVIPDDRTNSLIVSGNHAGIEKIKKLLTQLDFRIRPEDQGGVHVYYVKYGSAEDIVKTLQGVIKDAGPKPATGGATAGAPNISPTQGVVTTQEIFGGEVKMNADKSTNSIVTVASKQDYEIVLNILARLDIPRDQVYVEAVIMETNITDNMDYGVGYFHYYDGGGGAKAGFNGIDPNGTNSISNILGSPAGGSGAILGFASGGNVDITPAGQTTPVTFKSLVGFLTFLQKNEKANILSRPQILVMDNQEATIEVGDKVVTSIDSVATGGATNAIQTKPNLDDASIKLKIKPFVSPASNAVRMEMDQTIKQIGTVQAPKALEGSFTPIATRNIKTNIVVNSGDTAVLGGLIKENDDETITKVPLLGDIPIIGWLFKSRSSGKFKTNLSIFLTPKIIRSSTDQDKNLAKQLDRRVDFVKSTGGVDQFGKVVDELLKKDASVQTKKVIK